MINPEALLHLYPMVRRYLLHPKRAGDIRDKDLPMGGAVVVVEDGEKVEEHPEVGVEVDHRLESFFKILCYSCYQFPCYIPSIVLIIKPIEHRKDRFFTSNLNNLETCEVYGHGVSVLQSAIAENSNSESILHMR